MCFIFSGGDESQVALAIVQASSQDCGVYGCSIKNEYGTDSTDYLLSIDSKTRLLKSKLKLKSIIINYVLLLTIWTFSIFTVLSEILLKDDLEGKSPRHGEIVHIPYQPHFILMSMIPQCNYADIANMKGGGRNNIIMILFIWGMSLPVGEEIEMTPLVFTKGLADTGCWGDKFFGRIMTEQAHLGEGCSHKASRVKVIYGLDPLFESGTTCIIKIQNPIAYGTKAESNLTERNLEITKQVSSNYITHFQYNAMSNFFIMLQRQLYFVILA